MTYKVISKIYYYPIFLVFMMIGIDSAPFTDSGTGIITDTNSGLTWQKCSVGQVLPSCSGTASVLTWSSAISFCNNLSLGGKTWRLPNRNELISIVDILKNSTPSIDSTVFPVTQTTNYWTSTTYIQENSSALYVNFTSGYVNINPKTNSNYVRCVSGP